MRILILYPFLVKPGSLGGVARVTRLVEYLDARGHDVWLACFATEEELEAGPPDEEVRRHCREVVVLAPEARSVVRKAASFLFGRRPAYAEHFDSPSMRAEVRRILSAEEIDVLHVEFTYLGDYVDEAEGAGCATVLVDEELNFNARRRLFASDPFSLRGLRALSDWRRFRRHEIDVSRRFDRVLAITPGERDLLLTCDPGLDIGIYPNTVDTRAFSPQGRSADPGKLVFVGNFRHYPNADGIAWFVREVMPRVLSAAPEAHLDIIGANAGSDVEALSGDRVRVLGYVDDIRPHLSKASAFLCPLVNGGGMRGKALEAMAMGLPVVATSIGMEGIAAQDGRHALIADGAEGFAAAVVRLLRDPALGARLGSAARDLVRERYDDEVVFGELLRVYAELAGKARARAGERPRAARLEGVSVR